MTTAPRHTKQAAPTPLMKGEKVLLRLPEESDREAFIALRKASRDHLESWDPRPPPHFNAFGDDAFNLEMRRRKREDCERHLICRIEDGAIVGRLSLTAIERGPVQSARFGYWIGAPYINRGYMTEALRLGLRYCFTKIGLHRVECNIVPTNEPSRRVAQRVGFRLEGYSPRYIQIDGVWRDHERYAVTLEDWRRDQQIDTR